MVRHEWGGKMVDVEAAAERFPLKGRRLVWRSLRQHRPPMRAGDGVQIDRMWKLTVMGVFQMQLDGIADSHPEKRPRHAAIEGPEFILHAVGQRQVFFDGLEL